MIMYRRIATFLCICALSAPAAANPWQKFYNSSRLDAAAPMPSDQPPQALALDQDVHSEILSMYRKGNGLIGYSAMNGPLPKVKDALQFGQQLHAKYVVIGTQQAESRQIIVPFTTPTTRTAETTGSVTAFGGRGIAQGNYSATTTTYGSQTTYIPFIKKRFDTIALYFGPLAQKGIGIFCRAPSADEIAKFEARHALVIEAVRDGSPADAANILEGDVFLTLNGAGASLEVLDQALQSGGPVLVHLIRNGQPRDVTVTIPPEWKPN